MKNIRKAWWLLLVAAGCGSPAKDTSFSPFTEGVSLGEVSKVLEEASGLVASVRNPGYLWVINDSGNPSNVYLIDTTATIVFQCSLQIKNRDWEDIAIGPGPEENKTYVYVGDIGDNEGKFPLKFIYRFEEPLWKGGSREKDIEKFDTLIIRLPDGSRDSEAFTINPATKDLFLFSKREDSIHVYVSHFPITADTLVPQRVAILPYQLVVAADFSTSGTEFLLKTYENIYYWKKTEGINDVQMLMIPPTVLPYEREPQGESIAWARDGSGYFTLSETTKHGGGVLYFYQRK